MVSNMSKKFLSLFYNNNIQILYNSVLLKPTSLFSVSGQKFLDRNMNSLISSKKSYYCTDHDRSMSSEANLSKDKRSMTEEDRILLEKWLEMCRFQGERMPQNISEDQLMELFEAKSEITRKSYLNYLMKREAARSNSKLIKEKQKLLKIEKRKEKENQPKGHIEYGLWKNALFAKSNKKHVLDFHHHRLVSAMQLSQPLIIDLGFEDYLRGREIVSYAEQLGIAVTINRINISPFNLTFCNVNFDSVPFKKFSKFMPSVVSPSFPMNISSESYLDMFPRDKLVYLTPNAKQEMTKYDHDAIYIIGGIVDIRREQPLTLSKAKKENIKMQKLPLDRYHIFKGSKSLALHVMVAILLDMQETGDWKFAFGNIPKRLLSTADSDRNPWDDKRKPW